MNGLMNGTAVAVAPAELLQEKMEYKTARIGVIGLGYVGLPLAFEYAAQGFSTLGLDVSSARVDQLNRGHNYIQDLQSDAVAALVHQGTLSASERFEELAACDVIFICVPTPVTANKDPDTSFIEAASRAVAAHLRPGQLVILKSTTYPDTTEGVVLPILEQAAQPQHLTLGRDFFLAFSPERIDPGNQAFTTATTPVVVGGVSEACTRLASRALRQVVEHVHEVSSPKVAEMEKLLENIFRSVNIALVNELARLCDRMGGISIWEVVEAAATKPFGFMPFFPGPGLGGHCIPIDPYYLSWLARRYDFETNFITLSARVNEEMPFYVVEAVVRAVAEQPVRLKEAQVLILGAAFKKDVDDVRHSPALRVIELLKERGVVNVSYSDPHVSELRVGEDILESVALSEAVLGSCDVAVVVTDHGAFDYEAIVRWAPVVVDTRNALKAVLDQAPEYRDKVFLLGGGKQAS